MTVEQFRNRETGLVWAANPGTPEHTRMSASEQFERVEPERPKRRKGSGKSEDSTRAAAEADGEG